MQINFLKSILDGEAQSIKLKVPMNLQQWYRSARETVDDVIEDHFENLRPEGHRQLARIWQYLRDQEVRAIQQDMRAKAKVASESPFSSSSSAIRLGTAD